MHWLVTAVVAIGMLLQSNTVPLAEFTGRVHGVTKKEITIETEEGNLVEFSVNKKTRAERGGKSISVSDLKTGDPVTVEARQELLGYLVAVAIRAGGAGR